MRMFVRTLAAAGLLAVAGFGALAYGIDGSLDAIDSALEEGVGAGDPSAIKMRNFVRSESPAFSHDFLTLAKVVKEAEKGDFTVLSDEFLAGQFANMAETSAFYGLQAFQDLATATQNNPAKLKALLRANAKYIAKQAKVLAKYNEVWGDPSDESKVSLSKAAGFYAQVQKLYEIIEKLASKYNG